MSYPPTFLNELSNILGPGYDITFTNSVLSITYTPPPPGKPLIINLPPYPFPLSASGKLRIINAIATLLRPWTVNSHLSLDATQDALTALGYLDSAAVKLRAILYPDFSVKSTAYGSLSLQYVPSMDGPKALLSEDGDVRVMLTRAAESFSSPGRADLFPKPGGRPSAGLAASVVRWALEAFEREEGASKMSQPPCTVATGVPNGEGGGVVYRGEDRSPFDGRSSAPPWTPGASPTAARLRLGG